MQSLLDFPREILSEIADRVDTVSLITLAYTSRIFRDVVHNYPFMYRIAIHNNCSPSVKQWGADTGWRIIHPNSPTN